MAGAVASRIAVGGVIVVARASEGTAAEIHTTTANARMASRRWPAGARSAGSGASSTRIRARKPATRPTGILAFLGGTAAGAVAELVMSISGHAIQGTGRACVNANIRVKTMTYLYFFKLFI